MSMNAFLVDNIVSLALTRVQLYTATYSDLPLGSDTPNVGSSYRLEESGCCYLAKLALTNLTGPTESHRQKVCPVTFQVASL